MEAPKQKFPPLWSNRPNTNRRALGGCGRCADVNKILEDLGEQPIASNCGACQGDVPTYMTKNEREKP